MNLKSNPSNASSTIRRPATPQATPQAERPRPDCQPPLSSAVGGQSGCDGECASRGTMNALGSVSEYANQCLPCPTPAELHRWMCEGKQLLPPILTLGGFTLMNSDFAGFRDREVIRHFLRHASNFETAPNFVDAAPFAGDLLISVTPPIVPGVGPVNTTFIGVRVDIQTPTLSFPQHTTLSVAIGPAPQMPAAAGDAGPAAVTSWNGADGEELTRYIVGTQDQSFVSLYFFLGVVRVNQTVPNALMAQFREAGGVMAPFNVRIQGTAAGTTARAQILTNAAQGLADLAKTV